MKTNNTITQASTNNTMDNNVQKSSTLKLTGNTARISAGFLLTALASFNAMAAEGDAFAPGDSDSKWVVGGHVGSYNNPLAGEDTEYFIAPNIEYRGEKFFVKDGEVAYSLYSNSGFSAGAVLTANGSLLSDKSDYKNNEKLAGLEERDGTLDVGVYFMHTTEMGRLKVTLLDEITGEHGGQSADAHYTFDYKVSGWNVNPYLGANWNSSDTVDHFYGVSDSEANANRAAYKGDSAVNLYTGVRGRYEITKNWDVNVGAAYVHLGEGIRDSSIVEDDYIVVSHVGVNYNF